VLEIIRSLSVSGRAIFPLSATHVIETRKSQNIDRRIRLAQVMAEISRGWAMAPTYQTGQYELQIKIANTFGYIPPQHPRVFDQGMVFALGLKPHLRDQTEAEVVMPEDLVQRYVEFMTNPPVTELFLVGSDEAMNRLGTTHFEQSQDAFAKRVDEFRKRAKPHGHDIHKRAYVATLTVGLQSDLTKMLKRYGKDFGDFLHLGQDRLMSFFAGIPILDVETELVIGRNEHWSREVDRNDASDITFLSSAIPHCDVVVAEGYWQRIAQRSGLDKKYDTVILSGLAELEPHLDSIGTK
jgi:hypothetical protein